VKGKRKRAKWKIYRTIQLLDQKEEKRRGICQRPRRKERTYRSFWGGEGEGALPYNKGPNMTVERGKRFRQRLRGEKKGGRWRGKKLRSRTRKGA